MTVLSPAELAAIKARAEAATPGPWRWRGNTDFDDPRLVGGPRFGDVLGIIRRERQPEDREAKDYASYLRDCYVRDPNLNDGKGGDRPYTDEEIAERVEDEWLKDQWGETAYDDRLAFYGEPGPVYHYARDLSVYEVCPTATSRDDERVYRADIVGLRNPNAEFIAHSRADIDALLAHSDALEEQGSKLTREMDLFRRVANGDCICDTEQVDAGGYWVTKLNADAGCPQHGEQAVEIERLTAENAELRRTIRSWQDAREADLASQGWNVPDVPLATGRQAQLARQATFADAIGIAVRDELEAGESE